MARATSDGYDMTPSGHQQQYAGVGGGRASTLAAVNDQLERQVLVSRDRVSRAVIG